MKKQLEEDRQKLIEHIQEHLKNLKEKRKQLERSKNGHSIVQRPLPTNKQIKEQKESLGISNIADFKRQKQQIANKLANLSNLYQTKRELQHVGIEMGNSSDLRKYQNDDKLKQLVADKKQKKEIEDKKNLIIAEELKNTKKFLESKKKLAIETSELQMMNYKKLFKEKKEELQQYEQLLRKKGLSRVQKQRLISMSFQLICDWNKLVAKKYAKKFLIANPEFSRRFYITPADINRDLQVFETKQEGYFDGLQFYEYIKANEITNPALNPSLKKNCLPQKKAADKVFVEKISNIIVENLEQRNVQIQLLKDKHAQRKYCEYFRKIFRELDRFNEGLIQKIKYIGYLLRAWNIQKEPKLRVEIVKEYGQFLSSQSKKVKESTFYKQLDSKFLSYPKIEYLFKQFILSKDEKKAEEQKKTQKNQERPQINEKSEEEKEEVQEKQTEHIQSQKNESEGLNDFEKYGWKQQQHIAPSIKLSELDEYYSSMRNKYASEIEWNEMEQYRADFKQLQIFIRGQQANKEKNRKQQND